MHSMEDGKKSFLQTGSACRTTGGRIFLVAVNDNGQSVAKGWVGGERGPCAQFRTHNFEFVVSRHSVHS